MIAFTYFQNSMLFVLKFMFFEVHACTRARCITLKEINFSITKFNRFKKNISRGNPSCTSGMYKNARSIRPGKVADLGLSLISYNGSKL